MTTLSTVRIARPDDYSEIWRLFLQGHKENGIFTLAPQKVDFFVTRALWPERIPSMDTGPRGIIGVIGDPGNLEALAFLVIGEVWYTYDKHIGDTFVFVDHEHRKSRHAKTLLEWMQSQSAQTGLALLSGVVSSERTEAKCALYRRMFPKVGEFFMWSPTTVPST